MAFRPPPTWARREGSGPFIVKYLPAEALRAAAESDQKLPTWGLVVSHLFYPSTPTPLKSFVRQAKEHIAREYKTSTLLEDRELTIGGHPGYRMAFSHQGTLYLKTVVPRTNLESYLLDASMPLTDESKYRPAAEASIATFRIVPVPLGPEERSAESRTLEALRSRTPDSGLLGETWHAVCLMNVKTGSQHELLSESDGRYVFEIEVQNTLGEGAKDSSKVRGSFSPDGRYQSIHSEHWKSNAQGQYHFQATAVLDQGQIKASRDMNGIVEEKSFAVEPGVLFEDVADILRRSLARLGKGSYLFKVISPFADEPEAHFMEASDPEMLEANGVKRSLVVVFCKVGHRKHMTYYFDTHGSLVRVGGMRDALSLRECTKEEASRP